MATRFNDFVILQGGAQISGSFGLSVAAITNSMVSDSAAIDADKLQHRHQHPYSDESNTTVGNTQHTIHIARGSGTVQAFHVGFQTAMVGAANCDVDVLKNGTVITSSRINVDNSTAAWGLVSDSGFSNTVASAGDVFAYQITNSGAGGGTLGKGFFCVLSVDEATS